MSGEDITKLENYLREELKKIQGLVISSYGRTWPPRLGDPELSATTTAYSSNGLRFEISVEIYDLESILKEDK